MSAYVAVSPEPHCMHWCFDAWRCCLCDKGFSRPEAAWDDPQPCPERQDASGRYGGTDD